MGIEWVTVGRVGSIEVGEWRVKKKQKRGKETKM